MRHLLALLLFAGILATPAFAKVRDTVTTIDLGDGLKASNGYDTGSKFFYLPGRENPVEFPVGVFISETALSPDRKLLVLLLDYERPDSFTEYFGCLVCRRSDVTAEATWTLRYSMLQANLYLTLNRRTWVEKLPSVTNDGIATLHFAQCEKQVGVTAVLRSLEEWNLITDKRVRKLKDIK